MTKDLKDVAVKIQGKDYVLVKDRILYFNETYPTGSIQTQLVDALGNETVVIKAKVTPDSDKPDRYFTGYSQAVIGQGMVNRTAALENAETSAVGRALALMGIGVIDSVASLDEMAKASADTRQVPATPENDVMERHNAQNNVCRDCGAPRVKNPKTGKWFCQEKCWLKQETVPVIQREPEYTDEDVADQVPF